MDEGTLRELIDRLMYLEAEAGPGAPVRVALRGGVSAYIEDVYVDGIDGFVYLDIPA